MKIITFRRIGSEKNWKEDEKIFIECARHFLYNVSCFSIDYNEIEKMNVLELKKLIKSHIDEDKYSNYLSYAYGVFMPKMGLSYEVLSKKEKIELADMEFTFENWKKKSKIFMDNFIEKSKKDCPKEIHICFDDICFPMYVQIFHNANITTSNFLRCIRDYFLLNKYKLTFEEYRDETIYNNIRKKMIKIYPDLKKQYGMNKYLEKFLSYILVETDYNYEFVRNILENNPTKELDNDEKKPLKEKDE